MLKKKIYSWSEKLWLKIFELNVLVHIEIQTLSKESGFCWNPT